MMKKLVIALVVIFSCICLASCGRTAVTQEESTQTVMRQIRVGPPAQHTIFGPIVSEDREIAAYILIDSERGVVCSVVPGVYSPSQGCVSISEGQTPTNPQIVGPISSEDGNIDVYTLVAPGLGMVCSIVPGEYVPSQVCLPMRQQEEE